MHCFLTLHLDLSTFSAEGPIPNAKKKARSGSNASSHGGANDWMSPIGRRARRSVVVGGTVHGMTPSRFARGRVWLCARALVARFPDVHGLVVHQMLIWFNGLTLRPFPFFTNSVGWSELSGLFFLCMRDGPDSDV